MLPSGHTVVMMGIRLPELWEATRFLLYVERPKLAQRFFEK